MYLYHYTYRITNTKLNKHYYGTRTSKILPRSDLGIKYFSSSTDEEFKQDQKLNPSNYRYKVIRTFETREEAIGLEVYLHEKFDVGVNPNFYNKVKQSSSRFDNTGIKCTDETRKKMSIASKGKKKSKEHIDNLKKSKKNMSQEQKDKISNSLKGKVKLSDSHIIKLSKKIYVEGILYNSIREFSNISGIKHNTVSYRLYSDNFPEYYVSDTIKV
jgi:hypothetical protein